MGRCIVSMLQKTESLTTDIKSSGWCSNHSELMRPSKNNLQRVHWWFKAYPQNSLTSNWHWLWYWGSRLGEGRKHNTQKTHKKKTFVFYIWNWRYHSDFVLPVNSRNYSLGLPTGVQDKICHMILPCNEQLAPCRFTVLKKRQLRVWWKRLQYCSLCFF